MGTTYKMTNSEFQITESNINAALQALLQDGSGYYEDLDTLKKRITHYKHLPPIIQLKELVAAAWGYEFLLDSKEKNVIGIQWIWEKCAEMNVFEILAPYVIESSFIEMRGEDDSHWRWTFKNGKVKS